MQHGTVDFEIDCPYVTLACPVQPVHLYASDLMCPHVAFIAHAGQLGIQLG